jgi:hypothetical protein
MPGVALAPNPMQHVFTAVALNLTRLDDYWSAKPSTVVAPAGLSESPTPWPREQNSPTGSGTRLSKRRACR